MVVVAAGALSPARARAGWSALVLPGNEALEHLASFGLLAVLFNRFLSPLQAAGLAWTYGALIEALQFVVGHRRAEVADLAINGLAVTAFLLAERIGSLVRAARG